MIFGSTCRYNFGMWARTSLVTLWVDDMPVRPDPSRGAKARVSKPKTVLATRYVDPIRTLVSAFDRFNLIGLGERHQNLEDSQWLGCA